MRFKLFPYLAAMALLGLAAGSYGLVQRLLYGLNPVAFGSYVPWGLWVAFYLFFLGLSAGAFLVTILSYVLNLKPFESVGPISAFTVLICLMAEVLFILLDLGTMHRAFYQFFLTPSFSSMMTWMFVLFNAMGVIYLLKTYFLLRGHIIRRTPGEKGLIKTVYRILSLGRNAYTDQMSAADQRRVHTLAWISLPVGLLFYGMNGAFFAILMNRPIWNSALTPLLFIVAALLSGGALIAFLTYLFSPVDTPLHGNYCLRDRLCLDLGRAILFLLVVFLLLEVMQFFVGYQTGRTDIVASLNHIVGGPNWWIFWIVHLLIGSLVPLVLLVFKPRNTKAVAWACFLIFVSFVAVRYNFVIPDLAVYKLEGLEKAFIHARLSTNYAPNLNEWLVSLWIVSAGLLTFLLGARYLPLVTAGNGGTEHAV
jgi:molybdopterin-containing oxidoreductase family membrane subunit